MTINEMLKKVEAYNEVAELVGSHKAVLVMEDESFRAELQSLKSFRKFERLVRDEYIEEMAEAILNSKNYEFNETLFVTCKGRLGELFMVGVEFYLEWDY